MALPFINLYIGDLKKDTDLLSPAAFGAYMRLLLFQMHESKIRGQVKFTLPQLCRIFGASDLQQTEDLLKEIVNPDFEIVDYSVKDGEHFFINRRMVREAAISEARSKAGQKGAESTNRKNKQNKKVAEQFAAAKPAAGESANNTANNGQNYNSNNINSNKDEGGLGEEETVSHGPGLFVVLHMKQIFKEFRPKYIFRKEVDFPSLRIIAETIASQESVSIETPEGVERIKIIWGNLVEFMQTDRLFKDYQITQVERYFQAITSKYVSSLESSEVDIKKTALQKNVSSANEAKLFIQGKFKNNV